MKAKGPSGAQNRAKAKLAAEQARAEESARLAAGGELPEHVKQFLAAGPPPLNNPVQGVLWANNVAMAMLQSVLSDPVMPFEKRLRYASEFIGKIGLLHSKAHMQKRLADLSKEDEPEEDKDALEPNPFA